MPPFIDPAVIDAAIAPIINFFAAGSFIGSTYGLFPITGSGDIINYLSSLLP